MFLKLALKTYFETLFGNSHKTLSWKLNLKTSFENSTWKLILKRHLENLCLITFLRLAKIDYFENLSWKLVLKANFENFFESLSLKTYLKTCFENSFSQSSFWNFVLHIERSFWKWRLKLPLNWAVMATIIIPDAQQH